jgi:hypothetical protein
MNCKDCKYWQGAKRDEWGDCYRVLGEIEPKLFLCYQNITEDTRKYWNVPFDPHDVKYWIHDDRFMKYYLEALESPYVRIEAKAEEDIRYNQYNGERMGNFVIYYIQTNQLFNCEQYKEINGKHKNIK